MCLVVSCLLGPPPALGFSSMQQDFCVKEQDVAKKREASAEGSLGCVKVGNHHSH